MIQVLGAFDGFHKGHQLLLKEAERLSKEINDTWGVVTFSPHPQYIFNPERLFLLFSEIEKRHIASALQIPNILWVPFDEYLATLNPQDFLERLESLTSVSGIVIGENFRFGAGRKGDIAFLRQYCHEKNILFSPVPTLEIDGLAVSSTVIRSEVLSGRMQMAKYLLGYPFFIYETVIEGHHRGRELGFPTANLAVPTHKIIPPSGVYAATVVLDSTFYPGALNIGSNPTFTDVKGLRIEVHIPGFTGDLYGKKIMVFIEEYLRGEQRFANRQALSKQLARDAELSTEYFEKNTVKDELLYRRFSCQL